LREEARLGVFENKVLKRIFGPKRDGVIRERRKLHTEELRVLFSSPSIFRVIKSRKIRWDRHVTRMGREERRIQVFGEETFGKETTWKTQAYVGG
jgi:hypothetical protein